MLRCWMELWQRRDGEHTLGWGGSHASPPFGGHVDCVEFTLCERRVGSRWFLADTKSPLHGAIFFPHSQEKDILPMGGYSFARLQWLGSSRR